MSLESVNDMLTAMHGQVLLLCSCCSFDMHSLLQVCIFAAESHEHVWAVMQILSSVCVHRMCLCGVYDECTAEMLPTACLAHLHVHQQLVEGWVTTAEAKLLLCVSCRLSTAVYLPSWS